ncbi:MAG: hypothetical protein AAGF11_47915 [Myxococcota bacterium]
MSSRINPDEGEALRRAFAQDPPPSAEDPVDPDTLWEAVRGEAQPPVVAALVDRMARDPALAEDWRVARAFAIEAGSGQEEQRPGQQRAEHGGVAEEPAIPPSKVVAGEPANRGDYRRWGRRWGVVVALLAAAVLLVLAWPRGGVAPYEDPGDHRMRGGGRGIEAIRGEGRLLRDEAVLEWSEVSGAIRYELYVSTAELSPLLEDRTLESTSTLLLAERLRELPAGTELLWRVEAVMPDDRRIVSETFAFTVQ